MSAEIHNLHEPVYIGFTPVEYKNYFIGVEKIESILPEIRVLHGEHYGETEILYKEREMLVDYERYIALEQTSQFVLFTARHTSTGSLIGHLMYFLGPAHHTKGILLAKEDAFFITKAHRGGQLAKMFLKFAEDCLLELGVGQIGMTDKSPCGGKSLKRLLEPLGYKPVALQYVKEIGLEDK